MASIAETFEFVRRQHGCITRGQAIRVGLSRRQIGGLLERGEWFPAERGVYRHGAFPVTWHSRLFALCAATGGVASHRSAAVLWGLDGCRPGRLEITVPHGRPRRRTAAIVHRSTQWDRVEATVKDTIPTTGLGRTLLDLAGVVSFVQLRGAVNSARRNRQIDWSELTAVFLAGARRGRNGSARMRLFLDTYLREQRLGRSEWSYAVADLLVRAGLPRPELEFRVVDHEGEFVGDLDLAYPDCRLGVELDSVSFHFNHESFVRDPRRRNRLENAGWSVRNFTWADCTEDPDRLVVDVVRQARTHLLRRELPEI